MIDVYSWPTPNGHKVHIMLEECGLPYRAIPVNIGRGDQFKPEFLRISPNNKIPAIVDPDGPDGKPISMFESGAILIYLAAKTGRFMPESDRARYEVLQWLMFQMGSVGPMLGQTHHSACMRLTSWTTPSIDTATKPNGSTASSTGGCRKAPTWVAAAIPSPTSRPSPGCAVGKIRASCWPTTPT
jgi:glutathione S-transferase